MEEQVLELNEQVAALNSRIAVLSQEVDRLDQLKNSYEIDSKEYDTLQANLTDLKSQIQSKHQFITELIAKIEMLTGTLNALKKESEDFDVSMLKKKNDAIEEIKILNDQIPALSQRVSLLNESITSLVKTKEQIEFSIDENQKKLAGLISQNEYERNELRNILSEKNAAKSSLDSELNTHKKEVANLLAYESDLKANISILKSSLTEAENALAAEKNKISDERNKFESDMAAHIESINLREGEITRKESFIADKIAKMKVIKLELEKTFNKTIPIIFD